MVMTEKSDESLIVYLSGEIDHCCAEKMRKEIEKHLQDRAVCRLASEEDRHL